MTARQNLGTCAQCDQPAVDRHHVTGKGPSGRYLDAEFVVPLCHTHHELGHEDLRGDRIDRPSRGDWTPLREVEFQIRRAALFVSRVAECPFLSWCGMFADALQRWADTLSDQRDLLDRHCPGWQHLHLTPTP